MPSGGISSPPSDKISFFLSTPYFGTQYWESIVTACRCRATPEGEHDFGDPVLLQVKTRTYLVESVR